METTEANVYRYTRTLHGDPMYQKSINELFNAVAAMKRGERSPEAVERVLENRRRMDLVLCDQIATRPLREQVLDFIETLYAKHTHQEMIYRLKHYVKMVDHGTLPESSLEAILFAANVKYMRTREPN